MKTSDHVSVFGIRHHGPGSARSLRRALEQLKPDLILIEGPPDADEILPLAARDEMKPPVAILVYDPDSPQRAGFYPFAIFSPEWQAIQFGFKHKTPVRFCDLPGGHRLPRDAPKDGASAEPDAAGEDQPADDTESKASPEMILRLDPLAALAEAAGFSDSERWWDHIVESRRGGHTGVFETIADAMIALRETRDPPDGAADPDRDIEALREAWMRKTIHAALKDGHERIAVICGAWHVPALMNSDSKDRASQDAALLKSLPRPAKTAAAWVPWSYDRLAMQSGYGAGVISPEWYHMLWSDSQHVAVEWLTRAARLMRSKVLDVSAGHVIEATRLAEMLATFRGRPLPGLDELDEAALSVMCFGDEPPMQLIRERLVIGERLGKVPEDAPLIPLQTDLERLQKKLRLPARTVETDYDLDLRKPLDLDRSRLLHRLVLLDVRWGERRDTGGGAKGTFHELWRLQWDPEFVIHLVEAGRWGNTIAAAAAARVAHAAGTASDLRELTKLLDDALLADLADAVTALISAIQEQAAVAADVPLMMDALPPLASVSRYGNVRRTDADLVLGVVRGLVQRICIGLPNACASLNDEAARGMFEHLIAVHNAIAMLDIGELATDWLDAIRRLADQSGLHGLVAGRACRLLYDRRQMDSAEAGKRLSFALSSAGDPGQAAAWIEGLLAGSGQVLILDESLWSILDTWVRELGDVHFNDVLPLLRRTFATFTGPERRQMGERVKQTTAGPRTVAAAPAAGEFNHEKADAVLPVLARVLGVEWP